MKKNAMDEEDDDLESFKESIKDKRID